MKNQKTFSLQFRVVFVVGTPFICDCEWIGDKDTKVTLITEDLKEAYAIFNNHFARVIEKSRKEPIVLDFTVVENSK